MATLMAAYGGQKNFRFPTSAPGRLLFAGSNTTAIANPIGQIWCGAMMLDHFGHAEAGAAIVRAIESVLEAGPKEAPFTPDMGGKAKTSDLGKAIAEAI